MTYTFGIEIETCGASIATVRSALTNAGIRGCQVKPDGTPSVDAEIVLPPLAINLDENQSSQIACRYLNDVCAALQSSGARINSACGLHVHISNAPLDDTTHAARFTGDSIAHTENTGRFLSQHGEPMDFIAVQDIMQRYTRQQRIANSMFPRSRTNNRYCLPLDLSRIEAATNLSQLTFGKFTTINLQTWSSGTIEFRQASGTIEAEKIFNWVLFLLNLVEQTTVHRVTHGSRTIVTETPEMPFRRGARIGVQYTMMRTESGASTQEIMDATGCSEQRVRAAVSEIRSRVGDAAVITSTQQANGARYGDGTNHTAYRVPRTFETEGSGAALLPEHRIGNASIWAGVSDELFEWWQNRIQSLAL